MSSTVMSRTQCLRLTGIGKTSPGSSSGNCQSKAFLWYKYECLQMSEQCVKKLMLTKLASLFSCRINCDKPTSFIELYKINLLSFQVAVVLCLYPQNPSISVLVSAVSSFSCLSQVSRIKVYRMKWGTFPQAVYKDSLFLTFYPKLGVVRKKWTGGLGINIYPRKETLRGQHLHSKVATSLLSFRVASSEAN